MLFKTLAGLLASNTAVTLLVTGKEEAMTVTVIPKPAKAGEGMEAAATPMILNGSAEELDTGFCELLGKFAGQHKSLLEQFEATEAVLEAAKKASADKAAKSVTKAAKGAAGKPAASAAATTDGGDEDAGEGGGETGDPVTQQPASAPSDNLFA